MSYRMFNGRLAADHLLDRIKLVSPILLSLSSFLFLM